MFEDKSSENGSDHKADAPTSPNKVDRVNTHLHHDDHDNDDDGSDDNHENENDKMFKILNGPFNNTSYPNISGQVRLCGAKDACNNSIDIQGLRLI